MHKLLLISFLTISIMVSAQTKIYLTVANETRVVTLAENSATDRLIEQLGNGPISINMSDYGGFEKVGALPQSLPTSDVQISTVPGDIMLYQGNQMVIFYGTNTWSYTRLGKIDNATEANVRDFLGQGSVKVLISLTSTATVEMVSADSDMEKVVYDLNGRRIMDRPLTSGLYVINGKKTLVP